MSASRYSQPVCFLNGTAVTYNRFLGTIQAVTNTGGDALAVQSRQGDLTQPANRAENITIAHNDISGTVPDDHDAFSMVGILVLIAGNVEIADNRIAIADNPTSAGAGEGTGGANLSGAVMRGNFGVNLIEDGGATTIRNRSIRTLIE